MEQKNYKDIKKELFSRDFRKFFREKFSEDFADLEKLRKTTITHIKIIIAIAVIICLALIFYTIFVSIIEAIFHFCVFTAVIAFIICSFLRTKYTSTAKNKILPTLLSYIGDFEICDTKKGSSDIHSYVSEIDLFEYFNRFNCDDRFIGTYNNVKVDISELHLKKHTRSGKKSSTKTIFKGLFIKLPSFKEFKGRTYIKHNGIFNAPSNTQKVNLEDPDFEKIYDIFSTDQIEARVLITPAFMNRLKKLSDEYGRAIIVSFEKRNVNIAISSSKNWFEIPLNEPAGKFENYRNILLELIEILSVIDALKLDQNIGM